MVTEICMMFEYASEISHTVIYETPFFQLSDNRQQRFISNELSNEFVNVDICVESEIWFAFLLLPPNVDLT